MIRKMPVGRKPIRKPGDKLVMTPEERQRRKARSRDSLARDMERKKKAARDASAKRRVSMSKRISGTSQVMRRS